MEWQISHIFREENKVADWLATLVLEKGEDAYWIDGDSPARLRTLADLELQVCLLLEFKNNIFSMFELERFYLTKGKFTMVGIQLLDKLLNCSMIEAAEGMGYMATFEDPNLTGLLARTGGRSGYRALKISDEPSGRSYHKRAPENESREGHVALRIRADNHPGVRLEKIASKGGEQSNEIKE